MGNKGHALIATTTLIARHLSPDGVELTRREVINRCVTDAYVQDWVDVLCATTADHDTVIDYKFHGSGTDSSTESSTQTALGAETTEARDTGTQVESTAANIYKSVATHTYASTYSICEHGLFNNDTGGTMMDRTLFTAIDVGSGDSIEFTFTITFTSGG
jgi:hypothetical protein